LLGNKAIPIGGAYANDAAKTIDSSIIFAAQFFGINCHFSIA